MSVIPSAAYTYFLACDICNNPEAGRGHTEAGARSGLGFHKRHHHGVIGSSPNSQTSALTNSVLDAIGEYLEASGVILRRRGAR